jgi:HEAT repeat protein
MEEELIERALEFERAHPTDAVGEWPAIDELGRSPHAIHAARVLSASAVVLERTVAAHVLSVAANGSNRDPTEAIEILSGMIPGARDPHLQWAITDALSHIWDVRALGPLLPFAESLSADVRRNVAMGLGAAMCNDLLPEGVSALVRLSRDQDDDVRDWATFSLGGLEIGTPEVREALWARVTDPHPDTRDEALAGLAKLRDPKVADLVRVELESGTVSPLLVETATDVADGRLLKALIELREWWDVDVPLLETAIKACGGDGPGKE